MGVPSLLSIFDCVCVIILKLWQKHSNWFSWKYNERLLKVEEYFDVDSEILGKLWHSLRERYYTLSKWKILSCVTMEVWEDSKSHFWHRDLYSNCWHGYDPIIMHCFSVADRRKRRIKKIKSGIFFGLQEIARRISGRDVNPSLIKSHETEDNWIYLDMQVVSIYFIILGCLR